MNIISSLLDCIELYSMQYRAQNFRRGNET